MGNGVVTGNFCTAMLLVHVSQLQQSTSQYPRSVPRSLSDSVYDTKRHSHGFKPNRYCVWNYDSTYCAQNIGARKTKRIFVGVRSTMLLSLGAAILGMALYGIASKAILRIFLSDPSPEMVHYALQYLYTSVWFLLFLAWIFLFRNALVGLGNGLITIIGGVAELLCRFLCIHFLLQPFGFWCICLTNPITWIVACSLFCGFYFRWEHQQKHCSKSAR